MYNLAPNKSQQTEIRKLALEGCNPEEISRVVQVHLPSVESWVEHFIEEDKINKSEAAKAKKAAEEAAAAREAAAREAIKAELRAEIEAEMAASKAPKVNK